jgi:predicted DNA-binding transcriptional regulator AlpA
MLAMTALMPKIPDSAFEEWASIDEAAEFIGMSRGFLFDHRTDGKGPKCQRRGRKIVYRRRDLERWIEQQRIGHE